MGTSNEMAHRPADDGGRHRAVVFGTDPTPTSSSIQVEGGLEQPPATECAGLHLPPTSDTTVIKTLPNVPPVRLSGVRVTLHNKTKPGGDDLAIHEPFEVSALRIEDGLRRYLESVGDRIEPSRSQSRSAGLISRVWNKIAPAVFRRELSPSESFDVVRKQASGVELKLYSVTISKESVTGAIKVDIDRNKKAGHEGIRAAYQAHRILMPQPNESEETSSLPSLANETHKAPLQPDINMKHKGFAVAVADLRAEQKQRLDENAKVRAQLDELGLLPQGGPLLVRKELTEDLKRLETFGDQVREDLRKLVDKLDRGETDLSPQSDGSLALANFSYRIKELHGYTELDKDAASVRRLWSESDDFMYELLNSGFGIVTALACTGFSIYYAGPRSDTPGISWDVCLLGTGIGLLIASNCVVFALTHARAILSYRAFRGPELQYEEKIGKALKRICESREPGSVGEILWELERAGVRSEFDVSHPSSEQYKNTDCKVTLSIFFPENNAE